VLSAAAARNLGARSATADYVFFLDSDNWLIEGKMPWCGQILAALAQNPELVVLQREEEGRRFTTDVHPRGRNFSRYCIEWNLIWRRDHFFALGGFDELCGIGNPTLAQTGEVFDLCFKHFDSGIARTVYLPDLRVGHPSLVKIGLSPQRRFENAYGSSFVAIRPLKRRPSILSLFWFTRTVAGCTADIARAGSFAEARLLMGARFLGMWDALSREEPRSRTESERETKA
jgi:glycosyltransferase involved in cell wall biosynthesis